MASKKKKGSTAGLFFTFFLKAIVIILGLVILAMGVYLVKQIIHQKNSEADSISDEAVFEDDNQIDDLMIAPVTDVRPRIFGFDHLIVYSLIGDTIRVITVRRRGVQEFCDDMIDIQRIG